MVTKKTQKMNFLKVAEDTLEERERLEPEREGGITVVKIGQTRFLVC